MAPQSAVRQPLATPPAPARPDQPAVPTASARERTPPAPDESGPAALADSEQSPGPVRTRPRLALVAGLVLGAVVLALGTFLLVYRSVESRRQDAVVAAPGGGPRKSGTRPLGIEYHVDRNALADSLIVGNRIVALGRAGNLLMFDRDSFALLGERQARRSFVCIGPDDEKSIDAALSNGVLVRVNLADFSLTRVAEVEGLPEWLGRRKGSPGLLVVLSNPRRVSHGSMAGSGFAYRLKDLGSGREYPLDMPTRFFVDSKDRLWVGSDRGERGARLQVIDLEAGTMKDVPAKDGWDGLQGVGELADGQIWAFGGTARRGGRASFIVRVDAAGKAVPLWSADADRAKLPTGAPDTPIARILAGPSRAGAIVVSARDVAEVDNKIKGWKPMGSVGFQVQRGLFGGLHPVGRAHLDGERVILTLASGGFLEVTADSTRRHVLDGQISVSLPIEIVRMGDGLAFYGHGGPLLYARGSWRAVPETVAPPRDLMGVGRNEGEDRVWAALVSIPLDDKTNIIVAKAGPHRYYNGHIHGLKDTFITGQWKGGNFQVMSQEDLALEPDDTFATPDKQLWNVDNQGLWNFSTEKWRMVMSLPASSHGALAGGESALDTRGAQRILSVKSAVGEPLRFVAGVGPPWIGLPFAASAWSMARLDLNEAGGVPLIDEVLVNIDGARVQIFDAVAWTKGRLLLATNHGLCLYDLRWGNCQALHPSGLDDEVGVIIRDGSKRVWLAGRGLWLLESETVARPLHPAVPALAEADVVAMAEAPDGRLALGLVGRGAVILDVPPNWFHRPPNLPTVLDPWDAPQSFESHFSDQAVVIRNCQPRSKHAVAGSTELAFDGLKAQLAGAVLEGKPRIHLGEECTLDRRPDVGVYGPEADSLEAPVLAVLHKSPLWPELGVVKRYGPPGSRTVDVKTCGPSAEKK